MGTLYEAETVVLPKDLSEVGNVPNGASGVGNVAFMAKSSAVDSLVLYLEGYVAESLDTVGLFFALH